MKSLTFIIISLLSGILAGLILAGVNLFVVEPYIDQAIGIEVNNSIASGEVIDQNELNTYRVWQKEGTFAAGAFLGLTYGAIFGIVYVVARKLLPTSDDRKKAIILAAVLCLALYIIPFIKYPANPPAVGDPETIGLRENLYVGYQLASGLIAFGLSMLWYKFGKISNIKFIIPVSYVGLIAFIYTIFPANPDEISISMELVNTFRAVTVTTMIMFWIALGAIFGTIWHRFRPHEPSTRITAT
jgi:hypothetical protein